MYKYVAKRILFTIPVLLFITFIVFTIMSLTPGDPGTLILGITADKADIAALNHKLGYDQPFLTRFFNYVKDIVIKFDFGISYRTQRPVFDEILIRFPNTLKLAIFAIIFESIIGISLGILSAVKQYSIIDNVTTFFAMIFAAIPGFWLGMMLIYIFALKFHVLPSNGVENWTSFVLPTVALALSGAAGMLRLTRTTMLDSIRQDYIRTARAKGATEKVVIWKHALMNALLPVITSVGMSFGASLGGAIIAETVFAIPGIGLLTVTAIRQKDIPTVLACTLFLAVIFCSIMLIVDLIYAFIDPRIKAKYAKE